MNYENITYANLLECVSNTNSAFLCGNGFSINFDDRYKLSNLINRLYEVHYYLYNKQSSYTYDIVSNKFFKNGVKKNYKNALKIITQSKTQQDFEQFFQDAVSFASSLVKDVNVLTWIKDNGYNPTLNLGLTPMDLVHAIINQSQQYGTMYVNYEYWTILIYFVLALRYIPSSIYALNQSNRFIKAVIYGNTIDILKNTENGFGKAFSLCTVNGVYTYFRFLFTTTILLDGDSVKTHKLKNWCKYNLSILDNFLLNFNRLITTNYDTLLENITHRTVNHLHGSYNCVKQRIFSQSLGVYYNLVRYDLSSPIIGDYFSIKSFFQVMIELSNKFSFNSKTELYDKQLERILKTERNNTVVIFGLNVDNDYHIVRSIQINLSKLENPHIVYCYFNENDKCSFLEKYTKCITYSPELNNKINNIKISLINSQEIIHNIFIE